MSGGNTGGQFPVFSAVYRRARPVIPYALLYAAGLAHWAWFLQGADLKVLDWRGTVSYQSVLKDALHTGTIPFCMTLEVHDTNCFLAIPETPLSPQYLLLPFMDGWAFNLFNLCLLYSIGFAGLVHIRRKLDLSFAAFFLLYLLFNFNGYIVSRTAAGHTMWFGYFFLPLFHYFLLNVLTDANRRGSVPALALTLFLMALQGSFHLYVWCNIYLALAALFNARRARLIAAAAGLAGILCAWRLLPAAVVYWGRHVPYETGYASLVTLLDGLTALADYTHVALGSAYGWWEFDCYVGMTGLVFLAFFGWVRNGLSQPFAGAELNLTNLAMLLLCLGTAYGLVASVPIPILASQRLSSRFIIVPLTMTMLLASVHFDGFLRQNAFKYKAFCVFGLALLAWELAGHSVLWRVNNLETHFFKQYMTPLEACRLAGTPPGGVPSLYMASVAVAYPISLLALVWVVRSLLATRRKGGATGTPASGEPGEKWVGEA